jgi:septal ring factor EnvC (AmiA/AmiB activator)
MHLLKNGHPAHVFTAEDRRKAAAVTNQIRREMRELVELELLNRELERRVARIDARRRRKREQARRRRERLHTQAAYETEARRVESARVPEWFMRGYPAPPA